MDGTALLEFQEIPATTIGLFGVALVVYLLAFGTFTVRAVSTKVARKVWGEVHVDEGPSKQTIPASPKGSTSPLEMRLSNLETSLSQILEKIKSLESSRETAFPSSSVPAPPPPPVFAGGPPPPAPPPPPVFADSGPLKIKKGDGAKRRMVEEEEEKPSMAQVLKELSRVQRKVVNMISSPRSAYLTNRTTGGLRSHKSTPILRKSGLSGSSIGRLDFTKGSVTKGSVSDGDDHEHVPRGMPAAKPTPPPASYDGSDEGESNNESPNSPSRTAKHNKAKTFDSDTGNAAIDVAKGKTFDSNTGNAAIGGLAGLAPADESLLKQVLKANKVIEEFQENGHFSEATNHSAIPRLRSKASFESNDAQAALRSRLAPITGDIPKPDILQELNTVRLRKTHIPRSPGGTTLIPQRRIAPKSTEEMMSSLREKFAKAYPKTEETVNEDNDDVFS
ncbi:hypothetical protein HK104_011418 [Borealophlyctis nickersoniae]|nr:hypothetical protein HK104_011418 [Borealophlyctis nickersoniae]